MFVIVYPAVGRPSIDACTPPCSLRRPDCFDVVLALLAGIKPCVSSFGGDQLINADAAVVTAYFLAFYFSINVGSFVTYIVSPLARRYVSYSAGGPCVKHPPHTLSARS